MTDNLDSDLAQIEAEYNAARNAHANLRDQEIKALREVKERFKDALDASDARLLALKQELDAARSAAVVLSDEEKAKRFVLWEVPSKASRLFGVAPKKVNTGIIGRLEVWGPDSLRLANLQDFNIPRPGQIVMRRLKKNGEPSARFDDQWKGNFYVYEWIEIKE